MKAHPSHFPCLRNRLVLATAAALIVVEAAGCCNGPPGVRELPGNRYLPTQWSSYIAKPGQELARHPLRYDVLYVADSNTLSDSISAYGWYRFWPGGQVHFWGELKNNPNKHFPTAADGDEFRWLGAGRYSVIEDQIKMEFILPGETMFCPVYYEHDIGCVKSDGSLAIESFLGYGEHEYGRFFPHDVGKMTRSPDW